MDIERLLRDYGVPYVTQGHRHSTRGWINVHCPFCAGDSDFHLGIHPSSIACNCWRCGGHSLVQTLAKLLNSSTPEVSILMKRYGGRSLTPSRIPEPKVNILPFKYPQPFTSLNDYGKTYLRRRKFDPDYLEREWDLKQTGPISTLDSIRYSNRIIVPIWWNGKVVSFQGRDMTDRSESKYMACPQEREMIHHKNIIYGKSKAWGDILIVVEGVTDVWRLGENAVATFGIKFTMNQVLNLKDVADRFFVVFDDEPQAQDQARKLAVKLKALGKQVFIESIVGDPGGMEQDDADYFVRQLLKRGWILCGLKFKR